MKSEQLDQLATALAKAQSEIKSALKESTNPFFKSHYADLTSVWNACREALNKNGLSIVQTMRAENLLTTLLLHVSGQWIEGECPLLNSKGDMQSLGSAISYARRYGVAAICGVTTEDDDGAAAVEKPHEKYIPKGNSFVDGSMDKMKQNPVVDLKSSHKLINEKQAKMVYAKCKSLGMSSEVMKAFLGKTVGVWNTDHIPLDMLDLVLAKLDQTVTENASTWDMK